MPLQLSHAAHALSSTHLIPMHHAHWRADHVQLHQQCTSNFLASDVAIDESPEALSELPLSALFLQAQAEADLEYAFSHMRGKSVHNKRLCLFFLVSIRMLTGSCPSESYLSSFGLHIYIPFVQAWSLLLWMSMRPDLVHARVYRVDVWSSNSCHLQHAVGIVSAVLL